MRVTNAQAEAWLEALDGVLDHSGPVGYAAAVNTRRLREAISEYLSVKMGIIRRYGHEVIKNGVQTGEWVIPQQSPDLEKAEEELSEFAELEHEVDVMRLPVEKVVDELTGRQILELWFMVKDGE